MLAAAPACLVPESQSPPCNPKRMLWRWVSASFPITRGNNSSLGWVDRETQTPLLMLRANIHHPSPESFKASGIKDSEPAVPQWRREFPSSSKPQRPNQRSSRPINPTLPINPTPAREALQRRKEGAEDGSDGVWPPLLPENKKSSRPSAFISTHVTELRNRG